MEIAILFESLGPSSTSCGSHHGPDVVASRLNNERETFYMLQSCCPRIFISQFHCCFEMFEECFNFGNNISRT